MESVPSLFLFNSSRPSSTHVPSRYAGLVLFRTKNLDGIQATYPWMSGLEGGSGIVWVTHRRDDNSIAENIIPRALCAE